MPIRLSTSSTAVRVGPIDPNGTLPISIDLTDWLNGESVTSQSFTLPDEIDVGDGVTTFAAPSATITPPAPAFSGGVLTFSLFQASGQTLAIGTDYEVTVHYATGTKADDMTLVFAAANR